MEFDELDTPAFLVDKTILKSNCDRMIKRCQELGLRLRCHVKTHKCLEVASLQTGGKNNEICTSTLNEAEFFAEGGFTDIMYSYPFTPAKLRRCKRLAEEVEMFHVVVDSKVAVECLLQNPLPQKQWSVWVSVNCGFDREGVMWNGASGVELVKMLHQSESAMFVGLYGHCGDSYHSGSPAEVVAKAENTVKKMLHFVEAVKNEAGIDCKRYGIGSTPSVSCALSTLAKLPEVHAGNYAFYDVQQMRLGSCGIGDIACKVATRVVGHYKERDEIMVDCGYMALTKQGLLETGYGIIQDEPDLVLYRLCQELGNVKSSSGKMDFDKYPIGKMLFIYPYHACATSYKHQVYHVHEDGKIVDQWVPTRGF